MSNPRGAAAGIEPAISLKKGRDFKDLASHSASQTHSRLTL